MNELQIFNSPEFGDIRTVEIDGKPYFVANDVAKSLGYKRPADAVTAHCKGSVKHRYLTEGGEQEVKVIPEGDVYRLISRSKLPSAEKFERWVFDEVIPSIRKNGGYILGQETLSDEELMAKAILVAQKKIAERDKIIEKQRLKIEADKPKTIFADAVSTSHTSILIGDLAKLICQNGVQTGQKRLFQWMRENGYLMKSGASYNMPMQRYIEQGLFEVKESSVQNPDGSVRVTIGVNEEEIAKEIRKNVEDRVVEKITKEIKGVIYKKELYGSRETNEPLCRMIHSHISEILEDNKSVIVQEAAKALADKMIKTKAVKEAIKETIEKVKED